MISNATFSTTTTTLGSLESSESDPYDPSDFDVSDFFMFSNTSDDLSNMVSGYIQNGGFAMNQGDSSKSKQKSF